MKKKQFFNEASSGIEKAVAIKITKDGHRVSCKVMKLYYKRYD